MSAIARLLWPTTCGVDEIVRVRSVFGRLNDYITRNQSRLMLNVEASVKETPSRLLLVGAIYGIMAHFAPFMFVAACFLIGAADDLMMYWVRNRLRRRMRNHEFIYLALSNVLGATAFATFLAYILVASEDPIARIAAFVIFMATLVELASPKAGRHAFAFLTLAPVWIAMNLSLALVIWQADAGLTSTLTGFVVLGIAAVHTTMMFMENAMRTRTLLHETLRANTANEQKGRFLSAISHEIRTPLHAVYGTAQLLQTTTEPQEIRRLSQILQIAAADMKAIVDDIIDYSQIAGGHAQLRPAPTDPVGLANRLADLFRANAEAKGLTLHVEFPQGSQGLSVMLDPVRVGQVLSNLLSNAIAVTEREGVVIRVLLPETGSDSPKAQGPAAGMLRFVIDDKGPALSLADRRTIFEGEDIARCVDVNMPAGAGIGLAISKMLAEGMGGGLCAADAPGGGMRFTLGLPMVLSPVGSLSPNPAPADEAGVAKARALSLRLDTQAPMPKADTVALTPAAAPTGACVLQGMRVLVVDDVDINREVLRAMLERQGAEVHEASDGQQGLDQMDSRPFDLVLLDNMMPVMSGREMLVALRSRPGPEAQTMVIGISAGTLSEDRDAFVQLGLDAFLSKPVSFKDLTALVAARIQPGLAVQGGVPLRSFA